MKINVPYRQSFETVTVADDKLISIIEPNDVETGNDQNATVAEGLSKTYGSDWDLDGFLALPGSLLVIVNDGTRPTPTRYVLDAIGDTLVKANAEFIIATGAHRGPTREEYDFIFGRWYDTFKDSIIVHDSSVMDDMVYQGTTANGTALWLNKHVCNAGKVLVIGSVEPHYFAGYTGGRKAFLPGTAATISIEQNHKLALSPKAHARALGGNPVHEDMMEAVSKITVPVFTIMTVLDRDQKIYKVTAGGLDGAFKAAIEAADEVFAVKIPKKADVVVTCARYPMDVDLYQSQKAIDNAKLALKDGGTMILVASCREGIGGDAFYRLLCSADTPQGVLDTIEKGYKLGYHKAAKMAEVFKRVKVMAYTDLDDEKVRNIFMEPVHDLQKAIDKAMGPDGTVIFMPDGSVTVPMIGA